MDSETRRAYGLIATGLGLIGLTRGFKRRGMLRPYQFGYAATWVTLGSGIMQWTQVRPLLEHLCPRSNRPTPSLALCYRFSDSSGTRRGCGRYWRLGARPMQRLLASGRKGESGGGRVESGGRRSVSRICRTSILMPPRHVGGGMSGKMTTRVGNPWISSDPSRPCVP